MATFNAFANILPDPLYKYTDQGDIDNSGTAGPGFAGLRFTSNGETQVSRTNSGRGVHRDQGVQYWSFTIQYNPMLRDQFEPVEAFLAARNGRKNPFFVQLPQYAKPRDTRFAAWLAAGNNVTASEARLAGDNSIMVGSIPTASGQPKYGDMFNIVDPNNANHLKAYKVTAVETNARYQAGSTQPSTTQRRVWFDPPLQRNVAQGSTLVFLNPKFRVMQKSSVREYDLNTEGLYSFSLDLEEIQP